MRRSKIAFTSAMLIASAATLSIACGSNGTAGDPAANSPGAQLYGAVHTANVQVQAKMAAHEVITFAWVSELFQPIGTAADEYSQEMQSTFQSESRSYQVAEDDYFQRASGEMHVLATNLGITSSGSNVEDAATCAANPTTASADAKLACYACVLGLYLYDMNGCSKLENLAAQLACQAAVTAAYNQAKKGCALIKNIY